MSKKDPFPHANAEVHKKIMKLLKNATSEQLVQSLVHAGIIDSEGNLTEPYKEEKK